VRLLLLKGSAIGPSSKSYEASKAEESPPPLIISPRSLFVGIWTLSRRDAMWPLPASTTSRDNRSSNDPPRRDKIGRSWWGERRSDSRSSRRRSTTRTSSATTMSTCATSRGGPNRRLRGCLSSNESGFEPSNGRLRSVGSASPLWRDESRQSVFGYSGLTGRRRSRSSKRAWRRGPLMYGLSSCLRVGFGGNGCGR
jgi:hypothetical protein